jgi:hypothetical protein
MPISLFLHPFIDDGIKCFHRFCPCWGIHLCRCNLPLAE